MRALAVAVVTVVLAPACADPLGPPACPEFSCSSAADCLQGFVCSHGACAMPISCGDLGYCPQDGVPLGFGDCLWTGCECYANDQIIGGSPSTCTCTSDAQAQAQGWTWCDETTDICTNTTPPPASCAAPVACTTAPPQCAAGEIPAVHDGCYSGTCRAIADCDAPPPCSALGHESDCTARADCEPVYRGLDCTDPSGGACTPGDAQCTCKTFEFSSCSAR